MALRFAFISVLLFLASNALSASEAEEEAASAIHLSTLEACDALTAKDKKLKCFGAHANCDIKAFDDNDRLRVSLSEYRGCLRLALAPYGIVVK